MPPSHTTRVGQIQISSKSLALPDESQSCGHGHPVQDPAWEGCMAALAMASEMGDQVSIAILFDIIWSLMHGFSAWPFEEFHIIAMLVSPLVTSNEIKIQPTTFWGFKGIFKDKSTSHTIHAETRETTWTDCLYAEKAAAPLSSGMAGVWFLWHVDRLCALSHGHINQLWHIMAI